MNENIDRFTGKRIVVVGASSGIGKQTALSLSAQGAELILIARREELLKQVLTELYGKGHAYYTADISALDRIDALFKRIVGECGPIDALVYCAGENTTFPLRILKPEKLKDTFEVNFFAFIECVRQICKKGRYRDGMRIVGVSSNAAIRGDKAHTAYSASKAAMNAAVRCMAKELAEKGICINTVAPAVTNTELIRQYTTESGVISESETELLKRQYLGVIEPVDVANAIAFLISPSARMLTGITLPVDGGLSTN